jgi:arylsulfatase A-like enzyme
MNPIPVFTGKRTDSPHETLFFEYRNYSALLWDDWKIFRDGEEKSWQLFHLKNDIGENTDLSKQHPETVKKLSSAFDLKKKEIENYRKIEHTFNKRLKANNP